MIQTFTLRYAKIAPALILLASCSFAPGMHLDEAEYAGVETPGFGFREDNSLSDFRDDVAIVPITADLISTENARRNTAVVELAYDLNSDTANYAYRIHPFDVLQVTVWDHPELTSPAGAQYVSSSPGNMASASSTASQGVGNRVRQDGTIFYPYIGVVKVSELTVEEVRLLLVKKLATYIGNPQVDVQVVAHRGQRVFVTGEVQNRGVIELGDAPLTVLDAINRMNGVTKEADTAHLQLIRGGKSYPINFQSMLERGDLRQNFVLAAGDVINVPDNLSNKVFVLGEVAKQSTVFIRDGHLSLVEAISDQGGFDMETSNPGKLYVIRGELPHAEGKDGAVAGKIKLKIYRLNASSPDALVLADQFMLQPRDIVYVSTHEVARWGRVLKQLTPLIQSAALVRTLTR